ncbi:MAG: NADP-dependent glyceraldehyde-3-phosphate dehydrogenase [Oligoflexia bacterium]|nr:NADP-dependent glyceraldehyde-3-phosphate dehydrogenase [Oligoflexia bacterium]
MSSQQPQQSLRPIEQNSYLLDGKLTTHLGSTEKVYSPINRLYLGHHPKLTQTEALAILNSSLRAWARGRGEWPTMSTSERIACVEKFVCEMQKERELVIQLLMLEIGKPLPDSEREFDRTIDYIKDTITALKDLDRTSSRFVIEQKIIGQIRRSPLGIVLCMGPFNYPLNETFTTLIPALIMGNVAIFKPAKFGVLLWAPLLRAFQESFPPGVINTIYGDGPEVIAPLMSSGAIDVLAFIGSGKVADILKKQHPNPHRLRSILGLEAKNPAIILADADLDLAVSETLLGSLSFNGQRCTAIKMIFVHEQIKEEFLARFTLEVSKLKVGLPWEEGVKITPLPEENKCNYLRALVDDAVAKGAAIINKQSGGGTSKEDNTTFMPTILYPVTKEMRIHNEEQFGPVVPIASFTDITTPIDYIINSPYGQQASIFGTDDQTIASLVDHLVNQVSRVNINSQCQRGPDAFPFTGRKDSAEGTLSVSDALRVFSIRTLVAAKESPINKQLLSTITRNHQSKFLSTDFLF